jgi:hypothetical protein
MFNRRVLFIAFFCCCKSLFAQQYPVPDGLQNLKGENEALKNVSFEFDSTAKVKIILPGTYHHDELWQGAAKEIWTGVFANDTGVYIKKEPLNITPVYDVIVDTNGIETGREAIVNNRDSCILLISGITIEEKNSVETIKLDKSIIWPGDSLAFKFKGADCLLFATGEKILEGSYVETGENVWYVVNDYSLFLSIDKQGKKSTQKLIYHKQFDDAMTKIYFIGDIDGDVVPDFIIDVKRKYNTTIPALFLSKPSSKKKLLKLVALLSSVGC